MAARKSEPVVAVSSFVTEIDGVEPSCTRAMSSPRRARSSRAGRRCSYESEYRQTEGTPPAPNA
jgi:hypothetical protein